MNLTNVARICSVACSLEAGLWFVQYHCRWCSDTDTTSRVDTSCEAAVHLGRSSALHKESPDGRKGPFWEASVPEKRKSETKVSDVEWAQPLRQHTCH